MQEVASLVRATISGLKKSEPALASSLKKWIPFFVSTVGDLHKTTHRDPLDLAQDLLLSVVEANISYKTDLYKYNRRLYELDHEDGGIVRLRSPRYKKKVERLPFWVDKEQLKQVKKAQYDSYLYNVLNQQYMDILTLYFTQRNGWRVKSKKGRIKDVERVCYEVNESSFTYAESLVFENLFVDGSETCEKVSLANELIRKISSRTTSDANKVLGVMFLDPSSRVPEISRVCNISPKKVRECTRQIKAASLYRYDVRPCYFKGVFPVVC
jgi:hypothetical protein